MAKFKFIPPVPCTITNQMDGALSTLDCTEDLWGVHEDGQEPTERGFTLCRMKDPVTREVLVDEDGNDCLEVRVIGAAHVKWERYYVLIRTGIHTAKWFKHLPVALNMLYENRHCGEDHDIGDTDLSWVKEEGTRYLRAELLPYRNNQGRVTRATRTLMELGVLTQVNAEFRIVEDLRVEEAESVRLATEVKEKTEKKAAEEAELRDLELSIKALEARELAENAK